MSRPQSRVRNCNLLRDGVELAAMHAQGVVRSSRGLMSIVVRGNGAIRAYRRGSVPADEEPCVVGTYNARISAATLADDLALRLAEIS